jgi:uncharacterized membrane protein YfcA
MVIEIFSYLSAGALSGLLAGLFGIGGGLVVIPFLAFALPDVGFPEAMIMHVAVATSLANIVITSIVSVYSHHKRGGVKWDIFRRVLPSCIVGAVAGALLAIYMSSQMLETIFGLFVFFVAYSLLHPRSASSDSRTLPTGFKLNASMFSIAGFCSLLGMGGGSLMVPYYSYYNVPMRSAVGTSAAGGLFIGLSGLICLMLSEFHMVSPKPWMTGYLYWPAFACMSVASVAFAPLGAKLAHTLPVPMLKRFFAGFLVLVGISMLYKSFF